MRGQVMSKGKYNNTEARKVELIIRKLDGVSTLPEVAAVFLEQLLKGEVRNDALVETIESDPALTARVLSAARQSGVEFADDVPSIAEVVNGLGGAAVREALLSTKVFQAFGVDFDPDMSRMVPHKELARHSLAVACCASEIAGIVLGEKQRRSAFSAGLLHDIGKLAIDEVMPRSFAKIVANARATGASMHSIERSDIGVDHAVLGKRLAEKWALPEEIITAIWLHHSDVETISLHLPAAKLALVVQLADMVARQTGIGLSGSCDVVGSVDGICGILGVSTEQLDKVRDRLPDDVAQRARRLGFGEQGAIGAYCDVIAQTAQGLAAESDRLALENRRTGAGSAQMDLVSDFLSALGPGEDAVDIAARFAVRLQKYYQTGPVCVFLVPDEDESFVEMVTVDNSSKAETLFIELPPDAPPVTEILPKTFAICDAAGRFDSVLEKMDFKLDLSKARIAPLVSAGAVVAGVVFEPRIPMDLVRQEKAFGVVAEVAAGAIALGRAYSRHNRLSERLAVLLGDVREDRSELIRTGAIDALAEMAGGAAHELNNPLAVVSGRTQLLIDVETDEKKKETLRQIQERATEISQIVEDLMNFAKPKAPQAGAVSVRALIDEACEAVRKNRNLESIAAELKKIDELGEVFVDKSQMARAIANILSNCLDAYTEAGGRITIDGDFAQPEESALIRIIDSGCGMSPETLAKAASPFFSVRQAGRKRGMGLAHALRLVQLNKGSLTIASRAGEGTTVTLSLPRQSSR
jgi:putative nucleotidyltransferase with HDIG domain